MQAPSRVPTARPRGARSTGRSRVVSLARDGGRTNGFSLAPSLSGNGRYVAFHTFASDIVDDDTNGKLDVVVVDLSTDERRLLSVDADGEPTDGASLNPSMSRDGSLVAFQSDATDLVASLTNTSG